jgi:hypothetical protein
MGMQDKRFIESCKILCHFTPDYIGHWNLLLTIINMIERANNERQAIPESSVG